MSESMQNFHFSKFFLLALGLACLPINAQDASSPDADNLAIPADKFDRGTPYRSADGFLTTAGTGEYETAAEYLDLRNLRGEASELTGAQLARRLNVIVQRGDWVGIDDLIDDPAGRSNDDLPDYRDSIGVVMDNDKEIRLFMQKVPRGDGVSIWKISNSTVSLIPKLYENYGYPEIVENLRHILPDVSVVGFELFKWVIVIAVGVLAYGLVFLIAISGRQMLGESGSPSRRQIFRFLVIPFGIWVVVLAINATATTLGRGVAVNTWARVSPVAILATVWFMYAGMNLLRDLYVAYLHDRGRPGAMVLIHPVANAVKVIIAVVAILIYLDKSGVNITALLAGLGVGGIAVALALQKPMEDMFAAISLYTQQPIRVGDFCRIGNSTGTVEAIGMRTTRLRTLAHTVIAVPNHRLVGEAIDNISARGNIWYHPILRLRCDTTPGQLRQVLEEVRKLLSAHDRIVQDNHRVRFNKFAEHSLSIEVYAYLTTTDWNEFLELAEELNLCILEIVSQAGTGLFMPASSLIIEQGSATGDGIAAPI
jgi:MscS family membrane protein